MGSGSLVWFMGLVETTEIVALTVAGPFAMETVAGFTVIGETVKVGSAIAVCIT